MQYECLNLGTILVSLLHLDCLPYILPIPLRTETIKAELETIYLVFAKHGGGTVRKTYRNRYKNIRD